MIPHNKPTIGNLEIGNASRVLKSEWLLSGDEVRKFENEFSDYLNFESGTSVCVSSGSAALFLILKALGIQRKSIFIPSYTCVALRNSIELSNNYVKYLDTKKNSFNINCRDKKLKKTSFCVFPSMFGELNNLNEYTLDNVIYDNCQVLGAKINDKPLGSYSQISFYSFYATKIITSGGHGGIIASKNKDLIKEIKDIIYFDQKVDSKQRFNLQMTNLQAAIGRVQLGRLEEFISKRRKLYNRYKENNINLINLSSNSKETNYYRALIKVDENKSLLKFLNENRINAINPLTYDELLDLGGTNVNSAELSKRIISLPLFPDLKYEDVDLISNLIDKYLNDFNSTSTRVLPLGRPDS